MTQYKQTCTLAGFHFDCLPCWLHHPNHENQHYSTYYCVGLADRILLDFFGCEGLLANITFNDATYVHYSRETKQQQDCCVLRMQTRMRVEMRPCSALLFLLNIRCTPVCRGTGAQGFVVHLKNPIYICTHPVSLLL